MDDVNQSARTVAKFLQTFTSASGMRLRYRVKARGGAAEEAAEAAPEAAGPHTLSVEFIGPDTRWLTARNGELLNALEHIATKILRLEPEAHDQVVFDADQFKANRDRQLQAMAAEAIESVQTTGRPYAFPAMSSRERRAVHMLVVESGLPTASSGEGPGRHVVLYPADGEPQTSAPQQDTHARHAQIRERFRPRS
ncbi:MAG TPA: R3H domain-containing nucleic acid-binding protein [Acidobacteriaceae bacterium]